MAVTEQDRLALRAKLNEVLGERETDVLMDCVPPVDYEQLATRTDLETQRLLLSSKIESQGVALSAEINTLRADMVAEFAAVRGDMVSEFANVRSEFAAVHQRFADMDTKMAIQLRISTVTHVGSMIGLAAFMTAIT